MPRQLKRSWLESYLENIAPATESPEKFHFWSAVTAIAASMKRHVWVDRVTFKLYPHLYTVLVGRPGLGKGAAVNPVVALLKEAKVTNILSDRVTMEYTLEKLSKGFPYTSTATGKISIGSDACCLLVSKELSVFITASNFAITALSDLWDTEADYGYGTRGKGEFNIKNPGVSLLGASAQDWLVKSIPADAVGGGFTRRVNFVFASKKDKKVAWPTANGTDTKLKLIQDLKEIAALRGEFGFSKEAREIFEPYYLGCEPSDFDDTATAVYKMSKWANATKVAMCLSASRGNSMEISKEDFQLAIDKIEEVTNDLSIVFRAVGESPLVSATAKVLDFIEHRGYTTRQEILAVNWHHITGDDLDRIILTMRESGIIQERTVGKKVMFFTKDSIANQP